MEKKSEFQNLKFTPELIASFNDQDWATVLNEVHESLAHQSDLFRWAMDFSDVSLKAMQSHKSKIESHGKFLNAVYFFLCLNFLILIYLIGRL